jgi:hypothetical protein
VTDLAWLRHPSERSRLVLAVAASVMLGGLAIVLFAKRLERDQVFWTMAGGPALLALGWVVLQITRAHLLGNAVRVTHESLPELDEVIEDVRARLGYHRRVDVYVTDRVHGLMTLTSLFGTRIIMIEGDLVAATRRRCRPRSRASRKGSRTPAAAPARRTTAAATPAGASRARA